MPANTSQPPPKMQDRRKTYFVIDENTEPSVPLKAACQTPGVIRAGRQKILVLQGVTQQEAQALQPPFEGVATEMHPGIVVITDPARTEGKISLPGATRPKGAVGMTQVPDLPAGRAGSSTDMMLSCKGPASKNNGVRGEGQTAGVNPEAVVLFGGLALGVGVLAYYS